MPLKRDPNQVIRLVLKRDLDRSEATRPEFLCQAITARQEIAITALLEKLDYANQKPSESNAILDDCIMIGIRDWTNIPEPFTRDALSDWLKISEKDELVGLILRAGKLSEDDRKKSASPSPSATA